MLAGKQAQTIDIIVCAYAIITLQELCMKELDTLRYETLRGTVAVMGAI